VFGFLLPFRRSTAQDRTQDSGLRTQAWPRLSTPYIDITFESTNDMEWVSVSFRGQDEAKIMSPFTDTTAIGQRKRQES
jgi:hypothetical protein